MFVCQKRTITNGKWITGTIIFIALMLNLQQVVCRAAMSPEDLPPLLQPWVDWVLYDKQPQVKCIPHYNNPTRLECSRPGPLNLFFDDKGGTFNQTWEILHETWITLPGSTGQWPFNVRLNNIPAQLMNHGNAPSLLLAPGRYRITGDFKWQSPPESFQIPEKTGLFSLYINGKSIPFPQMDSQGRLWLKPNRKEKIEADALKVEHFRKIEDDIPPRMTLYATLEVAGKARKINLGPLYDPDNFIPLSLKSDLPVRLSNEGILTVQLKPGRYSFTLFLRCVTHLKNLTFEKANNTYAPDHEIWSVERRPALRIVEISGVPAVDPRLTSLPRTWQTLPAYRMMPGQTMKFKEIKRGDPIPAPDRLSLDRSLWLHFDGSGYTVQDKITGQKNSDWRLEMDSGMLPGKVTVDGLEQLITKRADTDKPGIELRKGRLNMTAENRFEKGIYKLPATGWEHDFNQVRGRLHLPPGWKLIHARGMDNIPGTWLKKWTLLDFFMVLIFTIAAAKLFSISLAMVGFVTLVLIFHEPYAPRYVWPLLLVGIALLRHLPQGKFKKTIKVFHGAVILSLLFTAIPYAVHTLRVGIYPQLEKPWISMNADERNQTMAGSKKRPAMVRESMSVQDTDSYRLGSDSKARKMAASLLPYTDSSNISAPQPMKLMEDPDAMTQTGPGLPRWQPFTTISFSWSGPVDVGETMSFFLIGPGTTRLLAFLRVGLITLLAAGLSGVSWKSRTRFFRFNGRAGVKMTVGLILICIMAGVKPCHAAEIPSPEMLQTLQDRLLEKEDCFPACADISQAHVEINAEELTLNLAVNAHLNTMVPLPGNTRHWLPGKVLIDDSDATAIIRENQVLWIMVPQGSHKIVLRGALPKTNTLQLPFTLKPSLIQVTAQDWTVQGLNEDGTLDGTLHFTRISTKNASREEILETGVLPAFARVERHLILGKKWQVKTNVYTENPQDGSLALKIPLITGESVTTRGVTVKDGRVQVNMNAGQTRFQWHSFLEPMDSLTLFHEKTREWTEIWSLDVAPRFHVKTTGIPVILHQVKQHWMPTWHPWPGEKVSLEISRPTAIKGNTLTLEKSHLVLRPGQRTTQAELSLEMKSSQGGQHIVDLPENARLEEISINGKVQLIRQEGRSVPLPLTPGTRNIKLKWREPRGMGIFYPTSDINLGHESVNASMDVYLPRDKWPLFLGGAPLTGPAVLFWSVLLVVVVLSAGIAMTGLTPLRFHHLFLLGLGMSMSSPGACFFVGLWLVAMKWRKNIMAYVTVIDSPETQQTKAKTVKAPAGDRDKDKDKDSKEGKSSENEITAIKDRLKASSTPESEKTASQTTKNKKILSRKNFNLIQVGLLALSLVASSALLSAVAMGLLGHPDMNIIGNGSSPDLLRWYQDISGPLLPVAWVISIPLLCYRLAMLTWALWISFGLIHIIKWAWQACTTPVIWYNLPRKPFRLRKPSPPEENKKKKKS